MVAPDRLTPTSDHLNLGCGRRFHPGWTNLDLASDHPEVITYDLRRGIPFADQTFRVVYHSHMLEHLAREQALALLRQCWRVLRPGGVIRVVVPDLEEIVRLYLQKLERSLLGDEQAQQAYEWLMLELYDQAVRERPAGAMGDYLHQPNLAGRAFILERSSEARRILERAASPEHAPERAPHGLGAVLSCLGRVARNPRLLRERMLRALLGSEYELLQLGRFRRGGEIHQWMYDRYSLGKLLETAGFCEPRRTGAAESRIPGWSGYQLDTNSDGTIYKPDSLFMEAVRR